MSGQLIVLPGVRVAASASAPRIDMTAADIVATRVASLKHVMSPRSLIALASGGVAGRCRATGLELAMKGASAANIMLADIAGKRALGLSANSAAALALPAGSLTNSYSLVLAVNLSADDISSASPVNFISGFTPAEVYETVGLRYYGELAVMPRTNRFITLGPSTTGTETFVQRATGAWSIVVVDYDNNTRLLSIAVNQVNTFATVTKGASAAQQPGAYLSIGYHLSASSLKTSKVGDLYTFNESLLSNTFARAQLEDLVTALKTEYGVS